uniref:PIH1 domain-containing protein 2 n=1 Tax=Fundulus heteroclitus TaxID=8078 RepID=A0A3Q2NU50_FUNHE
MSTSGGREDVLRQVSQFWSMLDDLSENEPAAYRKFIEEQMRRGNEFNAPPELHSCLRTQILKPKPGSLYINICSWKRVPAPRDASSPLPLCGGKLEACDAEDQGRYAVLDVALNPAVLQKSEEEGADMGNIYTLALRFARQQHGMLLSQEYSIVSCSPKGSPDDLRRRLGFQKPPSASERLEIASQTPASLLRHISSPPPETREEDSAGRIIGKPAAHVKMGLIQVISSTFQGPQEPEYLLEVKTDAAGAPCSLELTVELPKVRFMSECQLRVSKEDVLLQVEDVYRLLLEFPKAVNEDTASAVFNKRKRRLTLTVDVLL